MGKHIRIAKSAKRGIDGAVYVRMLFCMTTYETAEGIEISKARAMRILSTHSCGDAESVAAFLEECGDRETYDAQAVLRWLGY